MRTVPLPTPVQGGELALLEDVAAWAFCLLCSGCGQGASWEFTGKDPDLHFF